MGQITAFDISKMISDFGCEAYVETGTGLAVSLEYALQNEMKEFYTVDIDDALIEDAKSRLGSDDRITFVNDLSTVALEGIVPRLEKFDSVMFFLDAHFPGADFHKMSYEDSMRQYKEDSLPLKQELEILTNNRNCSNDVFIIDDLQLYEDGDYQHQVWTHKELKVQVELGLRSSISFVEDMFSDTHQILRFMEHQGYLVLLPLEHITQSSLE
jgi:hypothetical protein